MSNIWLTFRIIDTVDGSEIRQTQQLRLVVYPIVGQGLIHPKWLAGFLNHQQYGQLRVSQWDWCYMSIYFPTLKKPKATQSTGK